MFGAISIFLYTSVYTPLKTVTSLSVFVGAFPVQSLYAAGSLRQEILNWGWTLFLIQFFGNFHIFWAIGWFYMKIMKEQGFYFLQEEG
jgi:protoheme IX farnesyltransferase